MTKRGIVWMAVTFFLFSTLSAQLANPSGRGRIAPFSFNFHGSFGHAHHGFFGPFRHGFGPSFFAHPFLFPPRGFAFHQPFVFSGRLHRGFGQQLADPDGFRYHAGPQISAPFFFDPVYSYNYLTVGPGRSGWDWFAEEWADQDPHDSTQNSSSGLSESLILKEGMTEEAVMRALGSPVQRIRLGGKEIWKYSGYSLLFEEGTLKEMR